MAIPFRMTSPPRPRRGILWPVTGRYRDLFLPKRVREHNILLSQRIYAPIFIIKWQLK